MRTYIELNSSHLRHNLRLFYRLTGKKIMFVVKGNAYGHGLKEIIEATCQIPFIGYYIVDSAAEALLIKQLKVHQPVLLIGWTDHSEFKEIAENGIETLVHSLDHWKWAIEMANRIKKPMKVHLKIETGTARLGLTPQEALQIIHQPIPDQLSIAGIYSHFANIEDTTDPSYARQQMKVFQQFLKRAKLRNVIRHFSCSASALLFPETYYDMVRVGVSAYGYWPSKQTHLSYLEKHRQKPVFLKPVLNWFTHVAQVKTLAKGTPVGYGLTFKTLNRAKIAVIPVGYYDGYDRRLSNSGQLLIQGECAPVRGRICMNMMMAETTHIRKIRSGDKVTLLGKDGSERITADDLAERIGSINYEILSRINPLTPRLII